MTKTLRTLLAGSVLSVGIIGSANAIQLDNIPINATIVPPVEMAHRQVMNFGSFAAGTASSAITIANLTAANLTAFTGSQTTTRTSVPASGVGGAAFLVGGTTGTASVFSIGAGFASASIASVTLPATAITLSGCGTGVTVDNFTRFPAAALTAAGAGLGTTAVISSNVTSGAAAGATNVAVTNPDALGNTDVAIGRFEARLSVGARLNLPATGTAAGVCQGVYSLSVNY
jgi:hypothetical protein